MSFLTNLKSGGQSILDGISGSVARYANKDFLKAVTSGAALIVAADGKIEDDEIDAFVDFATTNPVLAHYPAAQKVEGFKAALTKAKDKFAQAELLGDLAKFKNKPEAVTIAEVLCVLAGADGDVAEAERKMIARITGRALGLDPAQYVDIPV